ncbi:hypothetical protein CGLO_14103 [Colletotrichum gloeosporioides Cg-14]|uniref:Uncharacterized protein n=1 Tax=Colletotrichum gloeosporioides (strain Cg-14) TaxID=1237896 RepID=T0L5I2_COLGC|nr:hypothetical protein CGLO_14103 [Colletotrichum gloeosporioides Cg-14]
MVDAWVIVGMDDFSV